MSADVSSRKKTSAERIADLEARVAALEERNTAIDLRAAETLQKLRTAAAQQVMAQPDVQARFADALVKSVANDAAAGA